MTQGFKTQILPFDLPKFHELAETIDGYKARRAKKLSRLGVPREAIEALNRVPPKKFKLVKTKIGAALVEACLKLEEGEKREDWDWTDEELYYDMFMTYLEKRDPGTFEMANQLAPIYKNKGFPEYRFPFKTKGYQGYLSREEARRLIIRLESKDLKERFAKMETKLEEYPELIHHLEPWKKLRGLLRILVMDGHDVVFWVDVDRKIDTPKETPSESDTPAKVDAMSSLPPVAPPTGATPSGPPMAPPFRGPPPLAPPIAAALPPAALPGEPPRQPVVRPVLPPVAPPQ